MNSIKVEDIKNMDNASIDAKLDELKMHLFKLRTIQKTTGIEKPHQLVLIKKNIARLLTVRRYNNEVSR
jgi:ribosomal protein L29